MRIRYSSRVNAAARYLAVAPVRILCLGTAVVLSALLFHVGSKPVAVGLIPAPWDKLAHLALFSTLTLLLWIGTAGRRTMAVVLIVAMLGAADEIHQSFLPGRAADLSDFLMDFCAALVTVGLLQLLVFRTPQPVRAPPE